MAWVNADIERLMGFLTAIEKALNKIHKELKKNGKPKRAYHRKNKDDVKRLNDCKP